VLFFLGWPRIRDLKSRCGFMVLILIQESHLKVTDADAGCDVQNVVAAITSWAIGHAWVGLDDETGGVCVEDMLG
jgi:hypothetical protein